MFEIRNLNPLSQEGGRRGEVVIGGWNFGNSLEFAICDLELKDTIVISIEP